MLDWDELSPSERQRWEGQVQVGGLVFDIHDDTDRLYVDYVADLPLAEWEWFYDDASTGGRAFGGHVQSLLDIRGKRPVQGLAGVDMVKLKARVAEAAQLIVGQAQVRLEADAWLLYAAARGVKAQERPWRQRGWIQATSMEEI